MQSDDGQQVELSPVEAHMWTIYSMMMLLRHKAKVLMFFFSADRKPSYIPY